MRASVLVRATPALGLYRRVIALLLYDGFGSHPRSVCPGQTAHTKGMSWSKLIGYMII